MTDTATKAYLDRYKVRENFIGDDGSIYIMRALRPSELFRLRDMLKDADSGTFNVMAGVASICEIEDASGAKLAIVFPKSRRDLDGMLDRVGFKGLGLLTPAFNKLNGGGVEADEDGSSTTAEADAA